MLLAGVAGGGVAEADGLGVLLAPAGDQISEDEALYAEAVVAAVVAEGRRAAFLHESSPLVTSAGVTLPAVGADDDWTPLVSVLDRIATRLRMDYVLLTSLRTEGELIAEGLLVVRGGEGTRLQTSACESNSDAAAALVEHVLAAMAQLPAPGDRTDDAVPLAPAEAPEQEGEAVVEGPGEAEDAPGAVERTSPEDDAPVIVADEPETASEAPTETTGQPKPQPVDDALVAAEEAYDAGNLADAEALLNASLRESGASARAYFLRARISLGRQDRDAAIGDLQRAVGLDPSLVEAQVWLARLLVEQGLWQSAQDHYERAVQADPTDREALLGLARVYRDHGHRRKAITLLTEADDLGQSHPSLLMLLAELHGAEGNVELAERYFLRAAANTEGEKQAAAWERLGDLYVKLHRHREALTCYVKAAELSPSRASMVERRYTEVMAAADGAVHEALTSAWSLFHDFAHNGVGEREMVYRRLSEMHAQLEEAMRFAESINPPGDLSDRHVKRQFAYSLAVEASVLALSWLDLGGESMLERADEVHADAVRQFEVLRQDLQG